MNRFAYFDASALVKLVHPEVETSALEAYAADVPGHVTSALGMVEVHRTLARLIGDQVDHEAIDRRLSSMSIVPIDTEVLQLAERLGPASLRTLDAIHLATAVHLRPVQPTMVTYDRRLLQAAITHGLQAHSPA